VRIPRSEEGRTAWRDAAAYRWSAVEQERLAALLDVGPRSELTMSPDRELVYSASTGSRGVLWSTTTGKQVATLQAHAASDPNYSWQERIRKACFSPDGTLLATVFHGDHQALLWDTQEGECVARLTGHTDDVVGVSFRPDGEQLLTASLDGTVRVWDVRTTALLLELVASDRGACCGAFMHADCASLDGMAGRCFVRRGG